jgi:flagellar hook-length control protein FliK
LQTALAGSASAAVSPPLPPAAAPDAAPAPAANPAAAPGARQASGADGSQRPDDSSSAPAKAEGAKGSPTSDAPAETNATTGTDTPAPGQVAKAPDGTAKAASSDSPAPTANLAALAKIPTTPGDGPPTPATANATVPPAPVPAAPVVTNPPTATVPTDIPTPGHPSTPHVGAGTARAPVAPTKSTTPAAVHGQPAAPVDAKGTGPSAGPPLSVQQALSHAGLTQSGGTSALAAAAPVMVTQAATTTPDRGDAATPKAAPAASPVATAAATQPQPAPAASASVSAPPTVAEQVGHAIQARLEVAQDGDRIDFHLRLDPPQLGQVRVQLTLSNQTLTARLVAHDDSTRQLIQSRMESLRQRLQETGLGLGQLDVSGGGGQGRGGRQPQPLPLPDLTGGGSLPRPLAASAQPARTVTAGIDVMA